MSWTVTAGSAYCFLTADAAGNVGACVTDGLGRYGNSERCTVRAEQALYATATEFSTESCCDYLTIGHQTLPSALVGTTIAEAD